MSTRLPLQLFHPRHVLPLCAVVFSACAWSATAPEAAALQNSYRAMQETLLRSPFKRPLNIASREAAEQLSGDLYATVEYGLPALQAIVSSPERWCEINLLLSNTKACHVHPSGNHAALTVLASSSKTADTAGATETDFVLTLQADESDYLDAALLGAMGPAGTRDITLRLQAMPLSAARSFVHLHYSYNTQWLGRIAMQAYLQTLGRGKLGFTPAPENSSGYIDGARAVIERNTMRYFLGLDCALSAAAQEAPERFGNMAVCWYGAVSQYPLQLQEMGRSEYLSMKKLQYPAQRPLAGAAIRP